MYLRPIDPNAYGLPSEDPAVEHWWNSQFLPAFGQLPDASQSKALEILKELSIFCLSHYDRTLHAVDSKQISRRFGHDLAKLKELLPISGMGLPNLLRGLSISESAPIAHGLSATTSVTVIPRLVIPLCMKILAETGEEIDFTLVQSGAIPGPKSTINMWKFAFRVLEAKTLEQLEAAPNAPIDKGLDVPLPSSVSTTPENYKIVSD